MLRMKPVKSAKRAEAYYQRSDGGYYASESGLRCEWGGKGAAKLGLEGSPEFSQLRNLLHGLDPHRGEQLTARLSSNRIAAWDVTASVPKGVTTALERGDVRIQDAIWRSFREAMGMLEERAATRIRKDGRQEDRQTGNLVWYAVEHPETRPVEDDSYPAGHPWRLMPDWDRHIHGVIGNLTFDAEEEQWKAVKFRPIMDLRKYFDRCFESLLSAELAGLGYEVETRWKSDRQGGSRYFSWDIKGIPESVLDRFSRRTKEVDETEAAILAGMKERGSDAPDRLSTVARDQLGSTSRGVKRDDLTLDDCRAFWHSRITDSEGRAIADTINRAKLGGNPVSEMTAEQAVAFSLSHHAEQRSVIPVEELAITAMEMSLGAATPSAIEREIHRQGLVYERNGRKFITTEALQEEELEIVRLAEPGRGVTPEGVPDGLTATIEGGRRLNDGQWQAVLGLLESPNRVNLVEGAAGTGKSSLLTKFDEAVRENGGEITWLATTSKAAEVLQKDGFDAHTLARFLVDRKMQQAATGGHVVIDETSMLGHKDALRLLRLAREHDIRLTAIGDPLQHGSVPRGAFHTLLKNHALIRPFRLTEILRQRDPDYLEAARLFSTGETLAGLERLEQKGWVHENEDDAERYRCMASEYVAAVAAGESVLVVSPTHREADRIQREIRDQLREAGLIGGQDRLYTRLVPVNASEAERSLARTYRPGDVIQFHQNAGGGYIRGQRLTVTDPEALPLAQPARFSLYRPEPIALAQGDRIRFTATVHAMGKDGKTFRNGSVATIAGFTKRGHIRLADGSVIEKDAGHLRHAAVETSFGSQGQTVSRVILGMGSQSVPAMNQEQLYVSATRGRLSLSLYTDDLQAVKESVAQSSQKLVALNFREKPRPEAAEHAARQDRERSIRHHLAHRRRRGLMERIRSAWDAFRHSARPGQGTGQAGFAARERDRNQNREAGYGR